MAALPKPPPWAQLIADRRNARTPVLSMAEAARRAGFSPALWAKIEHGYDQVATDVVVPYTGTADKVARAARVVGITPAELSEAGRRDAAAVLAALPATDIPESDKQIIADLRQRVETLEREFERSRERGSDDDQEGEQGRRRA